MPYTKHGFGRAVGEILSGFILSIVARAVFGSFAFLFNLLSIVTVIILIDVIPYWSISYLFGWLLGLLLVGPYLMSWWELAIYLIIGGFFLWIKIRNKFY